MTILGALAFMWSGAAMMLAGVLVGGILVFRTKRESFETLFPENKPEERTPVNIDDMFDLPEQEVDEMAEKAAKQNARFISQLAQEGETDA